MNLQDFSSPLTRAANSTMEPRVARTASVPLAPLTIFAYRQRLAGAFASLAENLLSSVTRISRSPRNEGS